MTKYTKIARRQNTRKKTKNPQIHHKITGIQNYQYKTNQNRQNHKAMNLDTLATPLTKSDEDTAKKTASDSVATALARYDFPVPGGP